MLNLLFATVMWLGWTMHLFNLLGSRSVCRLPCAYIYFSYQQPQGQRIFESKHTYTQ